jgi:hypothetical protein
MKKHFPHKKSAFVQQKKGSKRFLLSERNKYLARGRPDDLRTYRQETRKHPMRYAESWIGDSGDMGFPIIKIDARIADINTSREPMVSYGKFEWAGSFGGAVRWVPLSEGDKDARFEYSYHLKQEFTNKRKRVRVFNGLAQMYEFHQGPDNPRFVLGGDTFGFDNQSEAKQREDKSRKSDGGIAGYYPFDPQADGGKDRIEWDSDRIILTYRYKPPSTDAYNEDLLMAAIYLGGWVYPERNATNTWEYFIRNGFGGYLKYDINMSTGQPNPKPGYWLGEGGKDELFKQINDYLERNAFRERHIKVLLEAKDIRGPEQLKNFDLLAAVGGALLGARDMGASVTSVNRSNRIKEAYETWGKVFR